MQPRPAPRPQGQELSDLVLSLRGENDALQAQLLQAGTQAQRNEQDAAQGVQQLRAAARQWRQQYEEVRRMCGGCWKEGAAEQEAHACGHICCWAAAATHLESGAPLAVCAGHGSAAAGAGAGGGSAKRAACAEGAAAKRGGGGACARAVDITPVSGDACLSLAFQRVAKGRETKHPELA